MNDVIDGSNANRFGLFSTFWRLKIKSIERELENDALNDVSIYIIVNDYFFKNKFF